MLRRVHVYQSVSEAYGQLQIVATTTYERRSVPIPKLLIDDLAMQTADRGQDDFVWAEPAGRAVPVLELDEAPLQAGGGAFVGTRRDPIT